MIPVIAIVQSIDQQASSATTPLQMQEEALIDSVSDVKWEFIRQVFSNFATSLPNFRHIPVEDQNSVARRGYYIQAMKLALLLPVHDPDLVAIANSLSKDADFKSVALDFEKTYHAKYRKWPPIVPVDIEALTARMLNNNVIR